MLQLKTKTLLGLAALAGGFSVSLAAAQPMPSAEQMWAIIQQQQQQIQALQQQLGQTNQQVAQVEKVAEEVKSSRGAGSHWSDKVTVSGLIEGTVSSTQNKAGNMAALANGSDINLKKAELSIDGQVNPWVSANVTLLYENDTNPLNVDAATITVGNREKFPVSVTVGAMALPFGVFESNMVSDPITKEMAEIKDSAVVVSYALKGFTADVYAFNGGSQKTGKNNSIDQFGGDIGYEGEFEGVTAAVALRYVNSVENATGLYDDLSTPTDMAGYTSAWGANGKLSMGGLTLIGEYIGLTDHIQQTTAGDRNGGKKASAWQTELAYSFPALGQEAMVAVAYNGSDGAQVVDMMRSRYMALAGISVYENANLNLEWKRDVDYSVADGGSGNDADSLTLRLAVTF
ncbi:conserved hypothetical protein [Magnetococcus marinus MC-1]|uniref:Phosphate-selective porin O and P n=1 Tax=Magnetococcus marinus (strain ATCC BAA-1437 / JCM 17883 / MC-1) TaxID=156889 RepID=A0L6W4_MAGMM|nr:LbtU family siderophore porin [Magnetococcus marinus]ABK43707.1 conserved hypothetical protein [Magnetococcus marinus MC-1]